MREGECDQKPFLENEKGCKQVESGRGAGKIESKYNKLISRKNKHAN